ncbi:MAG: excisionase family DNA-binding protein [Lachnospiraceae bacterium]|nr:excisionase family DNA-binding protein [Lachnospiraceae bacterium]
MQEKNDPMENENVMMPVSEKYMLTIREASVYFNIGVKKMRRLAEDNTGRFAVFSGNKYLIIRTKFEEFVEGCSAL